MKAFPDGRHSFYQKRRREEQHKPTRGRTNAVSTRIRRDCERFAENINKLMEHTGYRQMAWFPTADAVTDREDDHVIDWRAVAERYVEDGYAIDDDGLLVNMQSHAVKATNKIEAVMVFHAERHDAHLDRYMLRKSLYSPFPCEEWGSLPLTLHQWRIIAITLIRSRVCWQWEAAVNEYAERRDLPAGYKFAYIVGWNMTPASRPSRQPKLGEVALWTGPIIYSLAITGFSNLSTNNGCQE